MSDDLDLAPRTGPGDDTPGSARPGGARRWVGIAVLVGVLAVGAFAVSQALGDATLFFRNADEAVAQRQDLAGERFRLQGLVVPDTIEPYESGVAFEVTYNGVVVPVEHTGDPEELFQADVPVVLEGQWSGTSDDAVFLSDRMLVKHDENYDAENPERISDADTGGDADGGSAEGDGS